MAKKRHYGFQSHLTFCLLYAWINLHCYFEVMVDSVQYNFFKVGRKNTSHLLLCAKSLQLCVTLWDPMDCSPPGSSAHKILQARILEWVAISFSRGSSWHRNQTHVSFISCIVRQIFLPLSQPQFSSVADSLWPHGLQHARFPCPLPTGKWQ